MNLQHIDEFPEKHSVGQNSFRGGFHISRSTLRRILLDELLGGQGIIGNFYKAEFEASRRAGLEKLMLKRRRGFGASMIVQPTLGSTMTLGS